MSKTLAAGRACLPLLVAVTGCQSEVDVPPAPEGMTGIISPPAPTASPVPGGQGSGAGPTSRATGDAGPPLPNAPIVDGGHVGFDQGPEIGPADGGSRSNAGAGDNSGVVITDAGSIIVNP